MKQIALIGTNSSVLAHTLSAMLAAGVEVNVMTDQPERVMLADEMQLIVTHYDYAAPVERLADDLEGYHTAVIACDDNLRDERADDITFHYFAKTVDAVRRAGASRLIVVGSPQSEAFFVSHLKRIDTLDWVFVSTEGDYSDTVVGEVMQPRCHREVCVE